MNSASGLATEFLMSATSFGWPYRFTHCRSTALLKIGFACGELHVVPVTICQHVKTCRGRSRVREEGGRDTVPIGQMSALHAAGLEGRGDLRGLELDVRR